jgi:hypothetical protein
MQLAFSIYRTNAQTQHHHHHHWKSLHRHHHHHIQHLHFNLLPNFIHIFIDLNIYLYLRSHHSSIISIWNTIDPLFGIGSTRVHGVHNNIVKFQFICIILDIIGIHISLIQFFYQNWDYFYLSTRSNVYFIEVNIYCDTLFYIYKLKHQ